MQKLKTPSTKRKPAGRATTLPDGEAAAAARTADALVAQQATEALALSRALRNLLSSEAARMQRDYGIRGWAAPNQRILAAAGEILELLKAYELDISECRRTLRVCEELAELGTPEDNARR